MGLYGEPEPEAYPNPFWAACEDPAACLDEPVPPKLALGDELSREVDRTLAEYCARVGCPPELCQVRYRHIHIEACLWSSWQCSRISRGCCN